MCKHGVNFDSRVNELQLVLKEDKRVQESYSIHFTAQVNMSVFTHTSSVDPSGIHDEGSSSINFRGALMYLCMIGSLVFHLCVAAPSATSRCGWLQWIMQILGEALWHVMTFRANIASWIIPMVYLVQSVRASSDGLAFYMGCWLIITWVYQQFEEMSFWVCILCVLYDKLCPARLRDIVTYVTNHVGEWVTCAKNRVTVAAGVPMKPNQDADNWSPEHRVMQKLTCLTMIHLALHYVEQLMNKLIWAEDMDASTKLDALTPVMKSIFTGDDKHYEHVWKLWRSYTHPDTTQTLTETVGKLDTENDITRAIGDIIRGSGVRAAWAERLDQVKLGTPCMSRDAVTQAYKQRLQVWLAAHPDLASKLDELYIVKEDEKKEEKQDETVRSEKHVEKSVRSESNTLSDMDGKKNDESHNHSEIMTMMDPAFHPTVGDEQQTEPSVRRRNIEPTGVNQTE